MARLQSSLQRQLALLTMLVVHQQQRRGRRLQELRLLLRPLSSSGCQTCKEAGLSRMLHSRHVFQCLQTYHHQSRTRCLPPVHLLPPRAVLPQQPRKLTCLSLSLDLITTSTAPSIACLQVSLPGLTTPGSTAWSGANMQLKTGSSGMAVHREAQQRALRAD